MHTALTMAHNYEFAPILQVAQKVNCPTDNRMAACLKMADPGALTLAGPLDVSASPDSKDYIPNSLLYIVILDTMKAFLTRLLTKFNGIQANPTV